jgi:hypothetical protein
VIDGDIFKYFGFVFYGVRGGGLGHRGFFNVVLLALYAKRGGVNVQYVWRVFLGLHVIVWIYVLDKCRDFCWHGNQAQSRKKKGLL